MKFQLNCICFALAVSNVAIANADKVGRYIIGCKKTTNKSRKDAINNIGKAAEKMGGTVVRSVPKAAVLAVTGSDCSALTKFLKEENCDCEADPQRFIIPPTDSSQAMSFSESIPWGIDRIYERDGVPPVSHFVSGNKKVCVIDSGYFYDHEDLPPRECVSAQGGCNDASACSWHGTHVSGTIGAIGGNNVGLVGVHPALPNITVVKVFGGTYCYFTYASDVIGAVQDCLDAGAEVTNMSLGGAPPSDIEEEAFEEFFYEKGMINIAAAGNGGPGNVMYPAAYSSIISVGATDINDEIAYFSSTNDEVDISAPGVDVESTIGPASSYGYLSGTSMACPHVVGATIALWNAFPDCLNFEIRAALENGATDLGPPGRDDEFGEGRLDYYESYDILAQGCSGTYPPTGTMSPTPLPTVCEGLNFTVELETDYWSYETSFELVNLDTNEVVLEGDGFASIYTEYTFEKCLSGDCYEFTIYDSYGDGICCTYGDGYYKLYLDGVEFASGGDFDSSDSVPFCTNFCFDSQLPIVSGVNGYYCNELESFCEDEQYAEILQSHCPVTCGVCGEIGCVDSLARWRYDPLGTFDCEFVASYEGNFDVCSLYSIGNTCQETCDLCA